LSVFSDWGVVQVLMATCFVEQNNWTPWALA
jgi:hypothetical protein